MTKLQKLAITVFLMVALQFSDAKESKLQAIPSNLNDAWRLYLNTDAKRDPGIQFPYFECFQRAAVAHDLPVTLLLALARGESDFDARAVSSANALGLMQILWPGTAQHLGINRQSELFKPCVNVDAGARYLKELLTHYRGNLHRALAAYNYGPSRIPVKQSSIPKGANWYSGYIYRHLIYVLGDMELQSVPRLTGRNHADRKLTLITFSTPYRAEAFVNRLQKREPGMKFDWFRAGIKEFDVVMLYSSQSDLTRGRRLLKQAGFTAK